MMIEMGLTIGLMVTVMLILAHADAVRRIMVLFIVLIAIVDYMLLTLIVGGSSPAWNDERRLRICGIGAVQFRGNLGTNSPWRG